LRHVTKDSALDFRSWQNKYDGACDTCQSFSCRSSRGKRPTSGSWEGATYLTNASATTESGESPTHSSTRTPCDASHLSCARRASDAATSFPALVRLYRQASPRLPRPIRLPLRHPVPPVAVDDDAVASASAAAITRSTATRTACSASVPRSSIEWDDCSITTAAAARSSSSGSVRHEARTCEVI